MKHLHYSKMYSSYSSDCYKAQKAEQCAIDRIHGFEGCSRDDCDFDGFYLCKYSPEGYCTDCEIKCFPERFHGCLFCRRPQECGLCCLSCRTGFVDWIMKNTNIKNSHAPYELISSVYNRNHIVKKEFIIPEQKGFHTWPGFYIGNNEWTIEDIKMETTEEITRNNCHQVLERLLEKHGIFIYADIQIMNIDSCDIGIII